MKLAYGHPFGSHSARDIPIKPEERVKSVYVIGSSGSGKSSLLETWVHQDIHDGVGFAVFDVEDRLAPAVLAHTDAVVIDPAKHITPLNILSVPEGLHPHTVVEGCVQTFQRYWFDSWGPRSEDIVRNAVTLLIEMGMTLGELPMLLNNQAFRERVANASENEQTRLFFLDHLRGITSREYRTWIEAVRNKVSAFMSNPFIAPCLTTTDCLNLQELMDEGRPLVVNLNEGVLGDSGRILGALLISRFFQEALRRKSTKPYILYLDEFQTLTTRSLLDLITRTRKRGLGCVLAHQTTSQPPFDRNPDFISTILSNVSTLVVMRVGREDAERFAKELFPAHGVHAKRRKKHWLWGDYGDPQFYSVQEEREQQMNELMEQHQREALIRLSGETFIAEAYDVPERPERASQGLPGPASPTLEEVTAMHEERIARFRPRGRRQAVENDGLDD